MLQVRNQRNRWIIILIITICLISFPAYAKYSGGSGETNDPYKIAAAEDLISLGGNPEDYDKHFILIADIDLPDRMVFDKAVIAPNTDDKWGEFQGIPFTGVFDGNGHTISNLRITGNDYLGLFGELGSGAKIRNVGVVNVSITASGDYTGALAGKNFHGTLSQCYSTGTISGKESAGGLAGFNSYGYIINCCSTCAVSGSGELVHIGGLLGDNSYGTAAQCYSTGIVSSTSNSDSSIACVGGLVGFNSYGTVTQCYSTSGVSGNYEMGGLVGSDSFGKITKSYSTGAVTVTGNYPTARLGGLIGACFHSYVSQCYSTGAVSSRAAQGFVGQQNFGVVTACFWDIQTSGRTDSAGGTGKTTTEMKNHNTYISAGWDLTGETTNGTDDIWRICELQEYPRLVWQLQTGDFICPAGITMDDFDFFMDHWGYANCSQSNGYCEGTDLDFSGTVDIVDYEILLSLWLSENP